MKVCTKCHIQKNILDFSKSNKTIDGHKTACKSCCNIDYKSYKQLKKQKATKACKVCK